MVLSSVLHLSCRVPRSCAAVTLFGALHALGAGWCPVVVNCCGGRKMINNQLAVISNAAEIF